MTVRTFWGSSHNGDLLFDLLNAIEGKLWFQSKDKTRAYVRSLKAYKINGILMAQVIMKSKINEILYENKKK